MSESKTIATWVLVIVIVAVFGVLLFVNKYVSDSKSLEINGFIFNKVPCSGSDICYKTNVYTNIGVHPIIFYTSPEEAKKYLVDMRAVEKVLSMREVKGGNIIIAIDKEPPREVGVAGVQISRITGNNLYKIPTKSAIYGEGVTCALSNEITTVVYLTQGPEGVYYKNDCVIISAPTADELIKVSEAFTMYLLNILPDQTSINSY